MRNAFKFILSLLNDSTKFFNALDFKFESSGKCRNLEAHFDFLCVGNNWKRWNDFHGSSAEREKHRKNGKPFSSLYHSQKKIGKCIIFSEFRGVFLIEIKGKIQIKVH